MADTNLFQELKDALQELKDFLDTNVPAIRGAVSALGSAFPQIGELLDLLIGLMNDIKTEIENFDPAVIPGLAELAGFTQQIGNLADTVRGFLPPEKAADIDQIVQVAHTISSLPSLDELREELLALIDAIVSHLMSLKSA